MQIIYELGHAFYYDILPTFGPLLVSFIACGTIMHFALWEPYSNAYFKLV
jgi:hypothetical protein